MFKIEDYLTPEELQGTQTMAQPQGFAQPIEQPFAQKPMFSIEDYLTPDEINGTPAPIENKPPTVAQGLQNVWNDVSTAADNVVQNAPQIWNDIVESGKQNLTAEGIKQTIPALAEGIGYGTVDTLPNLAGLGVDLVNSYHGYEKIKKPELLNSPFRRWYEAGKEGREGAWETDKAGFSQGLGTFLAPGAAISKATNAAKLANASKISAAQQASALEKATRVADKLDDVQKAKYARQIEKMKQQYQTPQEILAQAEKNKTLGRRVLDETTFGAVTGLTEGENLEERIQNALIGGAMGTGGTLGHAGISKGLKSKPVASALTSAKDKINNVIDNHETLAKGVGFIDNAMNLNTAQGKAKKYSELYKKASDASRFERTANLKEKEMLELADKLSAEDYKTATDILKLGEEGYTKKQKLNAKKEKLKNLANSKTDVMEEIISPYGDGKKRNLRIDDFESEQALQSNKTTPDESVKQLLNQDMLLRQLKNKYRKAKTKEEKASIKQQIQDLREDIKSKQYDNKKTKGKDSIVYDTKEYKDYDFENTEKSIEDYVSKYQQSDAGVDNLNKNYIPEGFHETKNNTREAYGREIVDEGPSNLWHDEMKEYNAKDYVHYDDTQRGLSFIKTYEKMKASKSLAERAKIFEEHIKNTPEEYRNQEVINFSEQALKDVEKHKYKSIEDSYDINKAKNLRQAKNMERAIFEVTKNHYSKPKTQQKYSADVSRKSDEFFGENIKALSNNKYALKALEQNGVDKSLVNHLRASKNPQKLYEKIFKKAQNTKNKELSSYNIKRLNEVAKQVNELLKKEGKDNLIETTNSKAEMTSAITELESAIKTNDLDKIGKLLSENNGFKGSKRKLSERQNNVVNDAYSLTVKDFEDRLNSFIKSEKLDYEGFKALEQEYKNKKKRIENTYKNFDDKEMSTYNVDYGRRGYETAEKFIKKGDTYNRQASGVEEQPYVKKLQELNAKFAKERELQKQRLEVSNKGKSAKGNITEQIKDVPENNHIHFIDGLLEKNVSSSAIISAIDEFIKTGKHTGETTLSDNLANFLKLKNGKVLTTFKPRQILKDVLDLDNATSKTLKEILSRVDSKNNNIFAIVNDDFYGAGGAGGTLKDGSTYVKFLTDASGKKSQRQLIRTTVHELIHNFARKYPDVAETLLGITKQDTINGFYANKRYREFLNSEEGAIFKKYVNASEETSKHLNKRIQKTIDKGLELDAKYRNGKEEIKAREFSEQVVKLFEDNYTKKDSKIEGTENVRKENEPSRDRQSVAGDDGRGRTDTSDLRGQSRRAEGKSEQTETGRELVVEEQPVKTPKEIEQQAKEMIESSTKELEKVEKIEQTFPDFVEQIFGKKAKTETKQKETKTTKKKELNVSDNIKTYVDYITTVSKATEDLLLKHKTMTPEMIKAALKKFGSEDGVYFKQFFGDKLDDYVQEKTGLLGTKKTQGKGTHGNAKLTAIANAQRMINFQHAESVVEYLKQNFCEKASRGKKHPENYVAVNSDLLWNALAFKKSDKWLETLTKGKTAMKEAFSEADYNEFNGLIDRAGKADIYLPKEALKAVLDGSNESIAQYFNNYVKGRKVDAKFVAKLAGAFLDFTNNQFKKAVLTTGSFFTNNRIGNQIMLAAKSGNLKDYVEGTYNALKAKDNVPSEIMTSLLLEACENFGGKRRYTGWEGVDNLLNLMDGHFISTKGQTGLKKASTFAANACIGMPNKAYNFLVDKVMRLNEKFERFERKQAYFQEIAKAKREGILKTGSKALTVEELLKHIDENPNLKEYVVDKVNDVLGDYNNFSNAEKKVFKRIIPFYSWHRTIFRHTIKLAKENPTRFGLIAWKLYMINNREDGRPDWQRGAIDSILGLWKPEKGFVINKKGVIPYATIGQDLTKVRGLIPGLSKDGGENIMGDINPALKTGYEALIGKKTFAPASEITHKDWKRVTKDKKEGYFNKKTGEFVEGTPWQVRAGYVGKGLLKTVYPYLENPSLKGTTSLKEISEKGKLPDKMYDASAGGYFNKEYIGTFNGRKKYRSAKMELPLKYQIANRALGLGIQKDLKSEEKMKKAQERYSNKRKKK